MEIRQLRYFSAVAETGSFTRGARREHVSQPSLSEQIKQLESKLGSELFDRLGQVTKLTAAGKTFYRAAQSVLKRLGKVRSKIQDAQNPHGGAVTVGGSPTVAPYFLPTALASFKRKYPLVRLRIVEESSDQLLQDLRKAAVDLVLLQIPVGGREFASEELTREPLYLAIPTGHRLASRRTIGLEELKEDPFLMLSDGLFRRAVLDALRKARVRPRIVAEVHGLATILALVSAGVGVSIVPQMAMETKRGCKFVALRDDPRTRIIGLVRLRRHNVSQTQRLLSEHLHRVADSQSVQSNG